MICLEDKMNSNYIKKQNSTVLKKNRQCCSSPEGLSERQEQEKGFACVRHSWMHNPTTAGMVLASSLSFPFQATLNSKHRTQHLLLPFSFFLCLLPSLWLKALEEHLLAQVKQLELTERNREGKKYVAGSVWGKEQDSNKVFH